MSDDGHGGVLPEVLASLPAKLPIGRVVPTIKSCPVMVSPLVLPDRKARCRPGRAGSNLRYYR